MITLVVRDKVLSPIRDWSTGTNLFDVEVDDFALRLMKFRTRLVVAIVLIKNDCITLLSQHR